MATNDILVKNGTHFSFQSSVYAPTGNSDLTDETVTVVDLTLDEGGSGLADGAAVNSDQLDLGAAHADEFTVTAALEWFAAVTANNQVDFYWSNSQNPSVAAGNPGNPDGVDGLYTGDGGGTVDESVKQMQFIGSLITTDFVGVQIAKVGRFKPNGRYGQIIVVNKSGTLLCGTDDIESSILMSPIIPEIQAAI